MNSRSAPLRRTLMQMIFISCGAALIITSTAYFAYELFTFRRSSVQQLQTLGAAIASNSTAALAFDNPDDAVAVLSAFKADPHITAAAIYDANGQVFAIYPATLEASGVPAAPGATGYAFAGMRLAGFQPVMEGGRQLGMLYVESSLEAMFERIRLYALIAVLVTALSMLAAYLISRRLQQRILRPILALAQTARSISDGHDYSVRAAPTGVREFDRQTEAFNHMLTQIQNSESRLHSQLARMDLLQHITRAIGDRLDMHSISQVVLNSLEANMPVDFACVLGRESGTRNLFINQVGSASRFHLQPLALAVGMVLPVDEHGLQCCLSAELIYEPDVSVSTSPFAKRFADARLCSVAIAPLVVEGEVSGALLCARSACDGFSSGECEFLKQLSEHVALASHQAGLYSALQRAYEDLKQSQVTILQQERLRALGQMASGIAHDINNAISPVSLYTESLLEREPNLSERARGYLTTIQQAIGDVARTVSRMREFYRERETQLTLARVDLNRSIRQIVDLTRPRWSDQPQQRGVVIDLKLELPEDLPDIMGADNEIRDALTNLIFNAVDAMPQGGTLTIRTRTLTAPDGLQSAVIEVQDSGIGMDEDTRRRCLEPFFTTKGERGTGLGLAMVYGMIQRHSAELEVDSTPGQGTTMRLIFAAYTASLAASMQPAKAQKPERALRMLLVDDDPMLIQSLQDILQQDGHEVTATSGGQAGIDAFSAATRSGRKFDVVITDLGMPYVDGRRVAAAIKALSASTPVILLTGWGQRLIATNDAPAHVDRVLSKPPRLQELRAAFVELVP